MATIGNMTLEELKALIAETVDERLTRLLGAFELDEEELMDDMPLDTRSWEEVKRDIEKHRLIPSPGTPSVNQLLREDRDS